MSDIETFVVVIGTLFYVAMHGTLVWSYLHYSKSARAYGIVSSQEASAMRHPTLVRSCASFTLMHCGVALVAYFISWHGLAIAVMLHLTISWVATWAIRHRVKRVLHT